MRSWWLVLVLLAACNQVLGLDETGLPPPDEDGDGIADLDDVCPSVPDPDQRDEDGDRFGDACDRCPGLMTARNHDEDGDRRGDACDLCPIHPDFGEDYDGDGVGDLCEFVTTEVPTRLVGFDPFDALDPALRTDGVAWASSDDAIAPVAATSSTDPGLVHHGLEVTSGLFRITVGAVSARPWVEGDQVGVGLVDDLGEVALCRITCGASGCGLELRLRAGSPAPAPIVSLPVTSVQLSQMPDARISCLGAGTAISAPSPPLAGRPVLHGSPAIAVPHLAIWAEGP